jgi:hypothetical protein
MFIEIQRITMPPRIGGNLVVAESTSLLPVLKAWVTLH